MSFIRATCRLGTFTLEMPNGTSTSSYLKEQSLWLIGLASYQKAGTNAWSWIERFDKTEDGRGGYLALCTYYDGPGETEKVEAIARHDLNELRYLGNEPAFSFEKFTMKLQSCLNILDQDFALEKTKVRAMFDHIHTSHPVMVAMIAMVKGKAENKNNFTNAANDLRDSILQLFSTSRFSKRHRRGIAEMEC